MKIYAPVHSHMSHVVVGHSSVHRDVAVRVKETTVGIDHFHLTVVIQFPPRHAINTQSPWIAFFARKFIRNEFVFAGAVAGYIVSRFLTADERFAVWDAVKGIPQSITQCVSGYSYERKRFEFVTGVYDYTERKLTISKRDGSFEVVAILPAEVASPFGVTWAQ